VDEIYRGNIKRLVERGSYTLPALSFPGVRYIPSGEGDDQAGPNPLRELWSET
jgi:hypothetical protein